MDNPSQQSVPSPGQDALDKKYQERGAQRLTLAEYHALQKKKGASPKLSPQLRLILSTPFLIVFCFGALFLPYMVFVILTSPSAETKKEKTGYEKLLKESSTSKKPAVEKP